MAPMLSARRRARLLDRQAIPLLSGRRWLGPCALGLIPGAGHAWYRRWPQAREFALGIAALILVALRLASAQWCGVVIGVATTLHAFSLVDLSPLARRSSLAMRLISLFALAAALNLWVYRPLLEGPLLERFTRDLPLLGARRGYALAWDDARMWILALAGFAALAWIAAAIRKRRSGSR